MQLKPMKRLNKRVFLVSAVAVLWLGLVMGTAFPIHALQRHLASNLQGQTEPIVLSLVVPRWMKDTFTDQLVSDFESANPGVSLHLVTDAEIDVPPAAQNIDTHLQALGKYVAAGDVLFVGYHDVSPEGVNAGYFLDLAPIASSDRDLNIEDFHAAAWQSFQWDKGLWALPVAVNVSFLSYNPAAFDEIGLSYPTDQWTPDGFINAVKKLTVKGADGKITVPGIAGIFTGYNDGMLIRSVSGETLYDDSALPTTPKLDKPAVEAFLKTWSEFQAEGLLDPDKVRGQRAPMIISDQYALMNQGNSGLQGDSSVKWVNVLLPGGKAGLDVLGFAVSSGTLHPEKAYALARFLTTHPTFINLAGTLSARKSLAGINGTSQIAPENQAIIDKALDHAIPTSELRYMDYFRTALQQIKTEQVDPKTALQTQQNLAFKDQQTAIAKKAGNSVVVATPVPAPVLKAGEVSLKFALGDFASPLPKKDLWDALIKDFTSSDPQVRYIALESNFYFNNLKESAKQYDCFYIPFNVLTPDTISTLLSLDPFMEADQSFDKSDMLGTTLNQLTIDNKVWGLPLYITPSILKYDSQSFANAGLSAPDSNWTIDKFKDTLNVLKNAGNSTPPYVIAGSNGTPLLVLMAAYGGTPVDFRTSPPTINYTDPANTAAIRQVLDLAKKGYIKYSELGNMSYVEPDGSTPPKPVITDDYLTSFTMSDTNTDHEGYKPVNYPRGTQYAGAAYGIGFAAISATSPNPEACYRWISTVAKHPELFDAMPARRSLLDDPALSAAQGSEVVTMYKAVDELLRDPNTLVFPDQMGGTEPTAYMLEHWLYEAFDGYVLHDRDLDAGLKEAEAYAKAFQDCTAGLSPYTQETAEQYYKAFGECAIKVDPRLKAAFAGKP